MSLNRVAYASFRGVSGGTNLSAITPEQGFTSFVYANPQSDYQTEFDGVRGDTNGSAQTVRATGQLVYHDFELRMQVYRNHYTGSEGFGFLLFQENSGADLAMVQLWFADFISGLGGPLAAIQRINATGAVAETLATASYNPPNDAGRFYFATYTYSAALGGQALALYYATAVDGPRTLIVQALASSAVNALSTTGRQCVGFFAYNVSGVAHRYYLNDFEALQDDNPPTPPTSSPASIYPILYAPDWLQGIEDGYSYLTDVIVAANDDEQRRALRATPRRYFRYRIMADGEREVGMLHNLLYTQNASRVGVPIWSDAVRLSASATASQTTLALTLTTVNREYTVGSLIAVFSDPYTWELATITATSSLTLTLSAGLTLAWAANSVVVPLLQGRLSPQVGMTKISAGSIVDLEFMTEVATP